MAFSFVNLILYLFEMMAKLYFGFLFLVSLSAGSSTPAADESHIYLTPRSWKTRTPSDGSNLTHPSSPPPAGGSVTVHPSPPPPPPHGSTNPPTPPPSSLHGHLTITSHEDPGYIDMKSPEKSPGAPFRSGIDSSPLRPISDAYISLKPMSYSRTIPEEEEEEEEETSSETSSGDKHISVHLQSKRTNSPRIGLFKDDQVTPSQAHHVYSTPPVEHVYSTPPVELDDSVVLRKKSPSRRPSKELHTLPNRPLSQTAPVRAERPVSLTKTLSLDVPLPNRNPHTSSDIEGASSANETSESAEITRSVEARRLKQQLPEEVSL